MCDTRVKRDFLGFFGEGGAERRRGRGKWAVLRVELRTEVVECSYRSATLAKTSRGVLSKKPRAKARGLRKNYFIPFRRKRGRNQPIYARIMLVSAMSYTTKSRFPKPSKM